MFSFDAIWLLGLDFRACTLRDGHLHPSDWESSGFWVWLLFICCSCSPSYMRSTPFIISSSCLSVSLIDVCRWINCLFVLWVVHVTLWLGGHGCLRESFFLSDYISFFSTSFYRWILGIEFQVLALVSDATITIIIIVLYCFRRVFTWGFLNLRVFPEYSKTQFAPVLDISLV